MYWIVLPSFSRDKTAQGLVAHAHSSDTARASKLHVHSRSVWISTALHSGLTTAFHVVAVCKQTGTHSDLCAQQLSSLVVRSPRSGLRFHQATVCTSSGISRRPLSSSRLKASTGSPLEQTSAPPRVVLGQKRIFLHSAISPDRSSTLVLASIVQMR